MMGARSVAVASGCNSRNRRAAVAGCNSRKHRLAAGLRLLLCLLLVENYSSNRRNLLLLQAFPPYAVNVKLEEQDPEQQQFTDQKQHHRSSNNASIIPNVLIAGAQKGGTTSISHYLHSEHNACFSVPTSWSQGEGKESHFFDIPWLRKRGIDYYRQLFAHCWVARRPFRTTATTPPLRDGVPVGPPRRPPFAET